MNEIGLIQRVMGPRARKPSKCASSRRHRFLGGESKQPCERAKERAATA